MGGVWRLAHHRAVPIQASVSPHGSPGRISSSFMTEASDTYANAAESIAPRLVAGLQQFGFLRVAIPAGGEHEFADTRLILKRQTWNTNRAVVLTSLQSIPADFKEYLIVLRNRTAVLCKYIPVLWEIGIQVVVVAPGLADPAKYVALVDNQWAI